MIRARHTPGLVPKPANRPNVKLGRMRGDLQLPAKRTEDRLKASMSEVLRLCGQYCKFPLRAARKSSKHI